jgi:hypothetical protein
MSVILTRTATRKFCLGVHDIIDSATKKSNALPNTLIGGGPDITFYKKRADAQLESVQYRKYSLPNVSLPVKKSLYGGGGDHQIVCPTTRYCTKFFQDQDGISQIDNFQVLDVVKH